MIQTLDLFPIGNCAASGLIDRQGRIVWGCVPRVDGDPFFSTLLSDRDPGAEDVHGLWAIEVEDLAHVRQSYLRNTPIVRTELTDKKGDTLEILDFCPRYRQFGRIYRPTAFIRLVRPISGTPRVRIRLRPTVNWGEAPARRTTGSNHIRYVGGPTTMRLTTNCPVSHITEERLFRLEEPIAMFLGPDEGFDADVAATSARMLNETRDYWRNWVRTLSVPLEWQEAVIRAAITLKLCAYEETGAIVAALTTSIPEHAESGRNWDYRYCWLRDAYYVVQALTRLGAADMLENYLSYLRNLVDKEKGGHVQPVYGVGLEPGLVERIADALPGYRGMGPVRIGNQAHEHLQHDVYGQIILSTVQAFFDERLLRPATVDDFEALEPIGDRAFDLHDKPDAGLWEFRGRAEVHTYSSVMCWAACDRLAKVAARFGLGERVAYWRERAGVIRERVLREAWNPQRGHFADAFGGERLDASLLLLADLGFVDALDPRFVATVDAIGRELKRGDALFRYIAPDDFGTPETSFTICTFWYIDALAAIGRMEEARAMFERLLARRNPLGLLSEDLAFEDGELWGNFPQTYSHVGLIIAAQRLSRPWTDAA